MTIGGLVGQLSVKGTLDTTGIEQGSRRAQGTLNALAGSVKGVGADLSRAATEAGSLAKSFLAIGGLSLGGLIAFSPALAGEFARIKTNLLELSTVVGQNLRPLFQEIGGNLIPSITQAIQTNGGAISAFVGIAKDAVKDISSAIRGQLSEIEGMVPKGSGVAIGAAAGFAVGGPVGMFVGAALGYAIGDTLTNQGKEAQAQIEERGIKVDPNAAGVLNPGASGNFSGMSPYQISKALEAAKGGEFTFRDAIQQLIRELYDAISRRGQVITATG